MIKISARHTSNHNLVFLKVPPTSCYSVRTQVLSFADIFLAPSSAFAAQFVGKSNSQPGVYFLQRNPIHALRLWEAKEHVITFSEYWNNKYRFYNLEKL